MTDLNQLIEDIEIITQTRRHDHEIINALLIGQEIQLRLEQENGKADEQERTPD